MSRLSQLRNERDTVTASAQKLIDGNAGAKWTPEVARQSDAQLNRITEIDREINTLHNYAQGLTDTADWKTGAADGSVKVLRSAADIRAHYKAVNQGPAVRAGEDPVRLDDFLRGVAGMKTTTSVQAALSVGLDSSGGFSVPTILMPGLLEALVPASSLLTAGAGIVPLDAGAKSFSFAAINAIPTAAWRLEAGAVAQSDPTFRAVTAVPQSLAFHFRVSRELLADGRNLQPALVTAITQAFAREIDRVGLRGTGTAPQPRGILNTAGVQSITNSANGASLTNYGNFFSAATAILGVNGPMPTAAIMSPRSLVKLGGLVDSTGQPLRAPPMLERMQMIGTSAIPDNLTVGTSSDCSEIYLADFTKLLFMFREQMSIQVLTELFATSGEIAFVAHARVDVANLYPQTFSVVTGVRA